MWLAGWVVLWLGLAGMVVVLGYTRTGWCLKYVGLGDLAIFVAFGLLPVLGSYWVQAERFALQPILWAIPLVAYTIGILHANNWRDIDSDAAKDCRTLAVRLGYRASRVYYRLLMLGSFALVIAYLAGAHLDFLQIAAPLSALAVLLALPMALKLAMPDWRTQPERFAMLD